MHITQQEEFGNRLAQAVVAGNIMTTEFGMVLEGKVNPKMKPVMSDHKPHFSKIWHFESAADITQFFLSDNFFKTGNAYDAAAIGKGGMIFRGQSNAGWDLVPSAFRRDNPLNGYTPQPPVDFYSDSKRFDPHHLHTQLGLH